MPSLEYTFSGFNDQSSTEILIAVLNDAGYSGFLEQEGLLIAYIGEADHNEDLLAEMLDGLTQLTGKLTYSCTSIPETNWNAKWESNFKSVMIEDKIYIRAPFHSPVKTCEYELIIEPKMSFGTGHHETTRLMVRSMLLLDFRKQEVLDMGCGAGVLGILASKLGAENILGIDIDDWACRNSIENAEVNDCKNLEIKQGDANTIMGHQFNIILANINRDILLNDMSSYSATLVSDGVLVISGIRVQDKEIILEEAKRSSFQFRSLIQENNWLSIIFEKVERI